MSITNECMTANLQIGLWQGYRLDKEASRKVTEDANADEDAARVNKHLIPKSALKPIVTAAGAIRTHFYAKTLPWKDNGDRLLTRKMYMTFIETHETLVKGYDQAVDRFLEADYPSAIAQAEFRMGDLFDPEDYPTVLQLRRRFYANLDIDAVTEAHDFRVTMDKNAVAAVQKNIEQAMQARISRAMGDVWDRLSDTLGHFAAKMKDDAIFRDSTVHNLEELVAALPALNLVNDPRLNQIVHELQSRVCGYEIRDLRKDQTVRSQVGKEAQKIMDDMHAFMHAFDGMKKAA